MQFFLTIALIHFLGVFSPGPDFVLVLRNALNRGIRSGIWTSLGIMTGAAFHLSYCLLGLAILITKTPAIFGTLKWVCAIYLCYLAWGCLRGKHAQVETEDCQLQQKSGNSFREGLLCNVLNPKCTLFFWSLFSVLLTPEVPMWLQLACCVEMLTVNFIWFSFVAFLVNHRLIRQRIQAIQYWLNKVMGVALLGIAGTLVLKS
jgi:RhtB (resistance to homoserine/threonine) family protein